MAEYIEREAAINFIKENQCKKCSDIGLCGGCAVLTAIKLFQAVPSADVAPVRHGRWINHGWSTVCSECGEDYAFAKRSYCPNCGAKMYKEEE